MKKKYRVKRNQDFDDIFKHGQSCANRRFVVYYLDKKKKHFRVGLSVSKKLGKAVTRVSIKRKLRHVLMAHQDNLVHQDFVVIARKGVEKLTYQDIESNLLHVLKLAEIYQKGLSSEEKN